MLIHELVSRTLFAVTGENGVTFSWADLQRVITFTDRWLRKRELERNGQFPSYDFCPEEAGDGLPIMHTFDQFVANLGKDEEEHSVQCKFYQMIVKVNKPIF